VSMPATHLERVSNSRLLALPRAYRYDILMNGGQPKWASTTGFGDSFNQSHPFRTVGLTTCPRKLPRGHTVEELVD
jgi:hypothetical protein